ncbi:MAG: hypothetical protein DRJ57_05780, partial [Thermoprotei archaeon]
INERTAPRGVVWNVVQVAGILSIILSAIAIWYARRQYILARIIQVLRPHSDRLKEEFRKWIEGGSFLPHVMDPSNLPEHYFAPSTTNQPSLMMNFAYQHLESGYPDLYSRLRELKERIVEHNRRVNEFAERLRSRFEAELGVPDRRGEQYAYYRRIVNYTLRKMLTPHLAEEDLMLAL